MLFLDIGAGSIKDSASIHGVAGWLRILFENSYRSAFIVSLKSGSHTSCATTDNDHVVVMILQRAFFFCMDHVFCMRDGWNNGTSGRYA